jgi:hypothetical protein
MSGSSLLMPSGEAAGESFTWIRRDGRIFQTAAGAIRLKRAACRLEDSIDAIVRTMRTSDRSAMVRLGILFIPDNTMRCRSARRCETF